MAAEMDQLGPELLVGLERGRGRPLRAALERELRAAIHDGRLHAGTALPSTRALAGELGVSRGVVVEAYAQLAAEGYLVTRPGAPARVAAVRATADDEDRPWDAWPPVRHDLRPGRPDLASFPRRVWLAALRRTLAGAPLSASGYGDPRGAPELRGALAAYLGRTRGVAAAPSGVVVTAGVQQGLGLLARALAARGVRRIAVEEPGFPIHRMLLGRHGLEPVPVPVDEDGVRVETLAATGVGAALLTPAHQFPMGAVLSAERRTALLAWAAATGAVIVEDDYDGEYRYDRAPVGALQGLDPERVAYLGSASKALAPALRLGWVIAPAALRRAVAEEKAWADGGSPGLDQLALADLIRRGEIDRHLRRMRRVYRARRDALLAAVREHLPAARALGVPAGLHLALALPDAREETALVAGAARRGVGILAIRRRAPGERRGHTVLLAGYANLPEPSIPAAVRALAAAVAGAAPGVPVPTPPT